MVRQLHMSQASFYAKIFLTALSLPLYFATIASAAVTLDGTMTPHDGGSITKTGNDYEIPDTAGTRTEANLFHSFGQFNLATGESATFTNGGAALSNIFARVTGGASTINGLISYTADAANLFLLNPAGVMFGPNASIDVLGSFHVSTADYISFSDGGIFYANPSSTTVLSVADPAAFGFLGSNPAAISGDNASLQVLEVEGNTLSLVGGDITYSGATALLSAPGGRINLVSVASPGEVSLADMGTDNFNTLGNITFSGGAMLNVVPGDPYASSAGSVIIRGGVMTFSDGGIDAYGNPGGVIDVKGDSLHLDNFYFYPASYNDIDHPGTACRIDLAGDLQMTHAAVIDTQNSGEGRGGDISITAKNVLLGDEILDANSYSSVNFYGYIGATTFGSGRSGDIDIVAEDMTVRNGFFVNTQVYYSDLYFSFGYDGDGNAGNITVNVADTLLIKDQGTVGTIANGSIGSNGGTINISAANIIISAEHETAVENLHTTTGILGQTSYLSNGGYINLTTDKLQLLNGGQISSVLYDQGAGATGNGTDVTIHAGEIIVSGYVEDLSYDPIYILSSVDARVFGAGASGTGGDIAITTDSLKLENGGNIRSGLYFDAPGNAGNITVNAGTIDINSLGQIYADSFRGTGNSGNLDITAQSMNITGTNGADPPVPLDFTFTGLSTTTNAGNGGAITLNLTGDLTMTAAGGIKADTSGVGIGGSIDITAQDIVLSDSASINASSTGTGNAGDISITAANSLRMDNSFITTEASENADGGNISITAPYMLHLSNSRITSSVGGGPLTTGGNITIDPQFVILNNSQVIANAFAGTGGNITIVADTFLSDPLSVVDASSALGVSGTVDIRAPISNVSGLLSPLSSDTVSASALLRERCMARIRAGKYSSFVVGGRDGLPIEPGNLMPGLSF